MLKIAVLFIISKTLPYSFCACIRYSPKIVTFVFGKIKLVSFSLFLDAPLDPKCPLHMLYMFIETCHCPKSILGLGGGASKIKLKYTIFKGGCTDSSEYTLVKIPHCWKSHVVAHLLCICMIVMRYASSSCMDQPGQLHLSVHTYETFMINAFALTSTNLCTSHL